MSARLATFTVVVTALATNANSHADKIFFTEYASNSSFVSHIFRMELDGSEREELFASLFPRFANSIAVDSFHAKLYVAFEVSGTSGIYRSNLDGTNLELVVPLGNLLRNSQVISLDVDPLHQKVYWAEFGGSIYRVDGSGGTPELVQPAVGLGVAIDPDREQVYWLDGALESLLRGKVSGGDIETVSELGLLRTGTPGGLDLDLVHRNLYWVQGATEISMVSMDGGEAQTIRQDSGFPVRVALDAIRGHIYWTVFQDKIYRANLDGTERALIASDFVDEGIPYGIALQLDCGNGRLDPGETCDVAVDPGWTGECVTECFDNDPCTLDELTGLGTCSARCGFERITEPIDRDGCCPSEELTLVDDSDCTLRPFPDVPAVSSWSAAVMSLLLAVGITLKSRVRHRRV